MASGQQNGSPLAEDCAIVVIDMHTGHVGPNATIPVPDAERIVPTLEHVLVDSRVLGIPVLHVRHENIDGIHNHHPAYLEKGWASAHCLPGTAEFVVQPGAGDYVIDYKRTFNAFAHTDLDLYLRRLRKDTVVITGLTSDCCCLATAFGAADLHYHVVSISDCQCGMTRESHQSSLDVVESVLGRVITSDEFLDEIGTAAMPHSTIADHSPTTV